jgi:hypothetical protein
MPKFTLPALKKPKQDEEKMMVESAAGMDDYQRHIQIPVNKAILDAVDTNDNATVTLIGKIVTKEDITGSHERQMITLLVESVEAYPEGKKAMRQAQKGYKRVAEEY